MASGGLFLPVAWLIPCRLAEQGHGSGAGGSCARAPVPAVRAAGADGHTRDLVGERHHEVGHERELLGDVAVHLPQALLHLLHALLHDGGIHVPVAIQPNFRCGLPRALTHAPVQPLCRLSVLLHLVLDLLLDLSLLERKVLQDGLELLLAELAVVGQVVFGHEVLDARQLEHLHRLGVVRQRRDELLLADQRVHVRIRQHQRRLKVLDLISLLEQLVDLVAEGVQHVAVEVKVLRGLVAFHLRVGVGHDGQEHVQENEEHHQIV
mmetsp:Transcript_34458/g.57895  ORF Transcript_34458/g.57895 Transcript_34458/m.57895 type:complete len:265 (-) Transcript_34458:1610-2404(-)